MERKKKSTYSCHQWFGDLVPSLRPENNGSDHVGGGSDGISFRSKSTGRIVEQITDQIGSSHSITGIVIAAVLGGFFNGLGYRNRRSGLRLRKRGNWGIRGRAIDWRSGRRRMIANVIVIMIDIVDYRTVLSTVLD
jgi:hypothetical protein